MKRALLIIFTIAVLGGLGLYVQKKPGESLSSSSNASSTAHIASSSSNSASTTYKDGTFTGASADTPYGPVQIAVVISGGKITDVNFLQMPSDLGHSREVTAYAEPLLKQTTLQAQSTNIEFVSGATSTSNGYEQSLQAALDQAVSA
ncbi:MAG TPA: FMN-binding protein [Candidatus Saccharimonadales bacterium]|nr:FMN-binding protein [Candidatus Saccharimonadales bacterium]